MTVPPLQEQKAIAAVLSSLDNKIELLREQNKTLEKIAQTLFKEWFIDFNFPDENGKPYKKSGGKMIQSELGEIPEGWELRTIEDICENIFSGGTQTLLLKTTGMDPSHGYLLEKQIIILFIKQKNIYRKMGYVIRVLDLQK